MSMLHHSMLTAASSWGNVHENWRQDIRGMLLPENPPDGATFARHRTSSARVQAALQHCVETGERVRGLGGRWSFSTVAATSGYQIDNTELALPLPLAGGHVRGGAASFLVLAQAGIKIGALSAWLGKARSLKTSGASDGQTLAGAISTGTHGAALHVGAFPDVTVGLHLATGTGRTLWLERATGRVATDELLAELDAELVADDEVFDAALVSFGSFGVLLAAMIEVRPPLTLRERRSTHPLNDALRHALATGDVRQLAHPAADVGQRLHHFDAIVNPHRPGEADQAIVTIMDSIDDADCPPAAASESRVGSLEEVAKVVLAILRAGKGLVAMPPVVTDPLAWLTRNFDDIDGDVGTYAVDGLLPMLVSEALKRRYPTPYQGCGAHAKIFGPTDTRGKIASTAIGVAAVDGPGALDLVLGLHGKRSFPLWIVDWFMDTGRTIPGALGNRLVKATKATLGFTRFEPTLVIEIDGIDCSRMHRFYRKVWKLLEDERIEHSVHWGKMYEWSPERMVARCRADRLERWLAARSRVLPRPEQRRAFHNDFLEVAGITA